MAMGGFLMGMSIIGGIMGFCVFLISFFMIYSVLSHFFILRKMKQHSKDIINSVMTGKDYIILCKPCFMVGIVLKLREHDFGYF